MPILIGFSEIRQTINTKWIAAITAVLWRKSYVNNVACQLKSTNIVAQFSFLWVCVCVCVCCYLFFRFTLCNNTCCSATCCHWIWLICTGLYLPYTVIVCATSKAWKHAHMHMHNLVDIRTWSIQQIWISAHRIVANLRNQFEFCCCG